MIRILVVEDEPEKKRVLVEQLLLVPGVLLEEMDFVTDAYSAKKAVESRRYDLLILDLQIAQRAGRRADPEGGIAVLTHIANSSRAHAPTYIVALTAYEAAFNLAMEKYDSPLWRVLKFSFTDMSWLKPLKQVIEYLVMCKQPPYVNDGKGFYTDLGILVALDSVELESLKSLPIEWTEVAVKHDHARYFRGIFPVANRSRGLDVVLVAASRMGMPTAAVATSKLIQTFRPRVVATTGICAGVRGKVRIGDILVADPCFDWGSGKWVRNKKSKSLQFRPAPYPWRLDASFRSAVKRLGSQQAVMQGIFDSFQGMKGRPKHLPTVHVEAMASGGSVLQAAQLMNDVRDQHKNLIGVDMENYAVFTAVEDAALPRAKCLAIKSVCDFGDEKKADGRQVYAAHTSAKFLFELVSSGALS